MNKKTCFILNYAPHYRELIFNKLIKELNCDIYCGDKLNYQLKKINNEAMVKPIQELRTTWFLSRFAWMNGEIKLLFNPNYKYYVITGQLFFISDLVLIILSKFTKKQVFIWNHGIYGREGRIKKLAYFLQYLLLDGGFIYSERGKSLLVSLGIKPEKLKVIYNSLNYDIHKLIRKQSIDREFYTKLNLFKNNSLPILIFIGRLETNKKLNILIDAVRQLSTSEHPVNLIIVGQGVESDHLKELTAGIEEFVHFFGPSYDEIKNGKLIANADLCVSPGNVGLTAILSLTFGTPVCTHDDLTLQMPEVEVIIPHETGFFFNLVSNSLQNEIIKWFIQNRPRNMIRRKCYEIIDQKYNPYYQVEIFKQMLH